LRRFPWQIALAIVVLAAPLSAQLAPVGAPKGTLRFTIGGSFVSADHRLLDGRRQDYLADFGSPALGSDRFPFLRAVDSVIGEAIGQPAYKVNLGGLKANGQLTVGTGIIGAALGVTRKLTLFANVPFVTIRVTARLAEDSSSADAGLNPAHPTLGTGIDQTRAGQFFNDFGVALNTLDAQIAGGSYAGDPMLLALAQSISARGARLRAGLASITNEAGAASPYLPTATSPAGVALIGAIRALQDTLANTLGVTSAFVNQDPVLAGGRLGQGDVTRFLSDPAGPIDALPLVGAKLSRMGDMDVGAVYTLVDRFDRLGHRPGGFRFAAQALLRLPTGLRDNPNNLLHLGTGNGRYELGLSGTADLGSGAWGARLTGGYLRRFSALRVRRVTAPDEPFPEATRLTNVRYKAGDIWQVGARPFFRLARNLAIHGLADYWREATGSASYYRASDAIPGVPASVLVEQAGRSALVVGGGVSYVGRAVAECQPGHRCGLPIDASWNYSEVVSATGGRVAQPRTTRIEIRWYQRLWR
jgi:hypothetical protein